MISMAPMVTNIDWEQYLQVGNTLQGSCLKELFYNEIINNHTRSSCSRTRSKWIPCGLVPCQLFTYMRLNFMNIEYGP